MPRSILLATNNPGKIAELRDLLDTERVDIIGLANLPNIMEVAETGTTFAENARLKAIGYARQAGLAALADDSGLEVTALGGRPGVLSARYGGEDKSFAEKMELLLDELLKSGACDRRARFACSMAIADPKGKILYESEGICSGRIALNPAGDGGFGYDPLFVPDGFDLTFGELPEAIKRKISHRAVAFSQIIPFLRHFVAI